MFWGNAGKDDLPAYRFHQVFIAHGFKFHAGNHAQVLALHDANPAGDAFSSEAVVPGNHNDADASLVALLNGFRDVHARRVHHGDHAKEGQVSLDGFHLIIVQFARERPRGGSQNAQPLAGKIIVLRHDEADPVLVERDNLVAHADSRANIQNFADTALDVSHTLDGTVHPLRMNHRHTLAA